jgi:hypothetical protein
MTTRRIFRPIPSDTAEARNRAHKAAALYNVLAVAFEGCSPYEALLQARAMGDKQWQSAAVVASKLYGVGSGLPSAETRAIVVQNFVANVQVSA